MNVMRQTGVYLETPLFNLDIRLLLPGHGKWHRMTQLYIAVAPHGLQMEIKTVCSDQRHLEYLL